MKQKTFTTTETIDPERLATPSEILKPAFVMCPPFSLSADNPNNVFMKKIPKEKREIDMNKAFHQFLSVYKFLSSNALVYLLPSRHGLQDLPYVANLGIKLPHINENLIVVANFKSEPRRRETDLGKCFFEMMGYKTIVAPKYFEGEADLKWLNNNVYVGGFGVRTNIEALTWFHDKFDMKIIPVRSTDDLYHLDCTIFPLSSTSAVVVEDAIEPRVLKAIEKHVEVITVPKHLGPSGVTNCVRVNKLVLAGSKIFDLKRTDEEYSLEAGKIQCLETLCAARGFEPVIFNLSEFSKSGAAISCMIMHLNYADFMAGMPE